jgi:hypothetical protein
MAKKEPPSARMDHKSGKGGKTTPQRELPQTAEQIALNLSDAQRRTILKYTKLPNHLSERLEAMDTAAQATPFSLNELDELLDHLDNSVFRVKGSEKQKVLRIVEKVSKLLGSTINPDDMPKRRLRKGAVAPCWKRSRTPSIRGTKNCWNGWARF